MLDKNLNRVLFLDIETTSLTAKFSDLEPRSQEIFAKRFKKDINAEIEVRLSEYLKNVLPISMEKAEITAKKTKKKTEISFEDIKAGIIADAHEEIYNVKAPIFPEFSKIIVITCGILLKNQDESYSMKIMSFADEDEKKLLESFVKHERLGAIFDTIPPKFEKNFENYWSLSAYNGRVFDFPFIAKRLIINGLKLPKMFDYGHLKPWDLTWFLDIKEHWTFGIYDGAVSLDCLANVFGVKSSKESLSGDKVKDAYWVDKNLEGIKEYCEEDVRALGEIFLRMKGIRVDVNMIK